MQKIFFLVQGSSEEPYTVTFTKIDDNLKVSCTCAAAMKGMYCKHRTNILNGDVTNIVSHNTNDVLIIRDMLINSDVERAMQKILELEKQEEVIKKRSFLLKNLFQK